MYFVYYPFFLLFFSKTGQTASSPEQMRYKSMYATTLKVTADLSNVTGSDVKVAASESAAAQAEGTNETLVVQNKTNHLCQLLKDLSETFKEMKPT